MKLVSIEVSLTIWSSLLIGYLIWLTYFLYFSSSFQEIRGRLTATGGIFVFVFIVFLFGLLFISNIYYSIVTKLFYPSTELELKIKKIKQEYRKNRRTNIKEMSNQIDKLILKSKLKELNKHD